MVRTGLILYPWMPLISKAFAPDNIGERQLGKLSVWNMLKKSQLDFSALRKSPPAMRSSLILARIAFFLKPSKAESPRANFFTRSCPPSFPLVSTLSNAEEEIDQSADEHRSDGAPESY
jgi:hypothetical protein